jgi:hypothetical protein
MIPHLLTVKSHIGSASFGRLKNPPEKISWKIRRNGIIVMAVVVFLHSADTISASISAQKVKRNSVIQRSNIGQGVIKGLEGSVTFV